MAGHSPHGNPDRAGPRPWLVLALAIPGLVLLPFAIAASILGGRYRRQVERGMLPESSTARTGYLLGATGVLLGIIQVCAFLYLLPAILHGWEPADEVTAISKLRRLHVVQSDYRKLTGVYAPSLDVLEKRGFIDPTFRMLQNYRLEMKAANSGRAYEARVISSEQGKPSYFIDQAGILRGSAGARVGPDSPPVEEAPETTR